MNDLNKFMQEHFENAIMLKIGFKKTEKREWEKLTVLNELYVQLGHLFYIFHSNDFITEEGRKIDNLGDEISDVLLQSLYLSYLQGIDLRKIRFSHQPNATLEDIPVLVGQLTEALMESEDYRFRKDRVGFQNLNDFIIDRIVKILLVVCKIADDNNIDLIKEFYAMIADATNFLENYEVQKRISL